MIKILGVLPRFYKASGAYLSDLKLLDCLAKRRFDVKVYYLRSGPKTDDGQAKIVRSRSLRVLKDLFDWSDLVITQGNAISRAVNRGKPVAYCVHNDYRVDTKESLYNIKPEEISLMIFNSEWVKANASWGKDSIVVNPLVFPEEYRTTRGDRITLVNTSEMKGANTFFAIAKRMPERKFLGVRGWGKQVEEVLQNVTIIPPTDNIRDDVYSKTRVLLMPSQHINSGSWVWTESWGRVGIEAMCSGIPVIAHPTPGTRESLSYAGIFVDRDDIDGWVRSIRRLDCLGGYRRQSELALKRASELDPIPQVDALAELIRERLRVWQKAF